MGITRGLTSHQYTRINRAPLALFGPQQLAPILRKNKKRLMLQTKSSMRGDILNITS